MLGVLVNALAILAGGSVGLLAKKGIPEKITNAIMTAIALCVIYIGVSGMLKGENTLVLIVSMELGVLFSSVPVFVYQGLLALLAHVIAPLLSDAAIAEITCCGSVMILAIGLNMLHLTKIKTADLLPAVLFAPVLTWEFSYLPL